MSLDASLGQSPVAIVWDKKAVLNRGKSFLAQKKNETQAYQKIWMI